MMHNFFVDKNQHQGEFYYITDSDFNHIKNVLRMKPGDSFLVSSEGKSDLCVLEELIPDTAVAKIVEENYQDTSLPVNLYLFQGIPKSDKMELVIQKAVELGAIGIIPVEMNRCVVKIEEKKKKNKQSRWQAIAESAAKQSKRTVIPEIFEITSYENAMEKAKDMDLFLVPYESKDGMKSTKDALLNMKAGMSVGIIIGPEGGFEENEVAEAEKVGGKVISLGKRILRTETAAITALSMCMLYAEMNIEEE